MSALTGMLARAAQRRAMSPEEREAERKDREGWAEIGRVTGLLEAADVAATLGRLDVAEAIRARIPPGASVHECRHVDESGGAR